MSTTILFSILGAIILLLVLMVVLRKRKQKAQNRYPENEQLYVGNLSYHANSHHLKDFFSQYGEVQNVRLIKNTRTGRSKGFAFVTYFDVRHAKKALAATGQEIKGRAIVVRMAKPREEM